MADFNSSPSLLIDSLICDKSISISGTFISGISIVTSGALASGTFTVTSGALTSILFSILVSLLCCLLIADTNLLVDLFIAPSKRPVFLFSALIIPLIALTIIAAVY